MAGDAGEVADPGPEKGEMLKERLTSNEVSIGMNGTPFK